MTDCRARHFAGVQGSQLWASSYGSLSAWPRDCAPLCCFRSAGRYKKDHHEHPDYRRGHRRRAGAAGLGLVGADREAVRAGGAVPAGPAAGPAGTRAEPDHPRRRRAAPGLAADRHAADPVPGHHHPRQRQRRCLRGRLLQGGRRDQVGGGDRERPRGHRPDRPDHPAQGRRAAHPGPRRCPRPTRSTWTSARPWRSPPRSGASR